MFKRKYIISFVLQALLFCLLIGSTKQEKSMPGNFDTMQKAHLTWLALGDSYTIGESVNENERFPAQTIALLKNESLFIDRLQYIATTGWTTQNLLDAITKQKPGGPFDVVTLLIGVNDQYQHMDTAGYRIRFTQCLEKAITLAGNKKDHVFILSIPDYSITPFSKNGDTAQIRKELDEFNAINKQITLSYNISYIDITPFTREAKNDASLIAGDGLHPTGKEYAKWATLLAPSIAKVLK